MLYFLQFSTHISTTMEPNHILSKQVNCLYSAILLTTDNPYISLNVINMTKAEGISSMAINSWLEEYSSLKEKLPFIKCQCGKKILLLPDSKAMDKAIENHVAEHMRKQPDPAKAEAEAKRISELLIKQALKKASEMNPK